MKLGLALIFLCLAGVVRAADQPNLLLFVSHEYTEETRIGIYPYYGVWVDRVGAAKSAAHNKLASHFRNIAECEGSNVGDVIARIKPQLYFNPMTGILLAQVKVDFILGDGQLLATINGAGQQFGYINSYYIQNDVQEAFGAAMQNIAEQYAADTRLQESIHAGLSADLKRTPCAVASLIASR